MQELLTDQFEGQVIGSYHIDRLIGRGRLSAVYLAQQPTQNVPMALTTFIIPEQFSTQSYTRFMSRFMKEASALVMFDHPNVLPVYEYGEYRGSPYLITPYMTQGSLNDILKQQGQCSVPYTLSVLEQVGAALDYMHRQGVIHGTLRSSNILLGDQETMLLAGCGLGRILEMRGIEENNHPYPHLLTIAGTFLGSPEYIAPELVQGQPADIHSDIYALGILLFQMLSGSAPFTGAHPLDIVKQHLQQPLPSLRALRPDISPSLEQVITQALMRNPLQRFQSVSDLIDAFTQIATHTMGDSALSFPDMPVASPIHRSSPYGDSLENDTGWQFVPPVVTGQLSDDPEPNSTLRAFREEASSASAVPILSSNDLDAVAVDPFKLWKESSRRSSQPLVLSAQDDPSQAQDLTTAQPVPAISRSPSRKLQSRGVSRRRMIVLLAAGGVVTAGALVFAGESVAHIVSKTMQSSTGNMPHQSTTNHTQSSVPAGQAMPTQAPVQMNTQPPKAQPPQIGMVIGTTINPQLNSANSFMNPANNQPSILFHFLNGGRHRWAAYERLCPNNDQGLIVLDLATQMLTCPQCHSTFDPLTGPAITGVAVGKRLTQVPIRVNNNGTITTI